MRGGGGSGGAAASSTPTDWLYASLSAEQLVAIDEHVEFDGQASSGTNIAADTTTAGQGKGLITVQPGTYLVLASLKGEANEGASDAEWRDDADDSALTDITGAAVAQLHMVDNFAHDVLASMDSAFVLEVEGSALTFKLDVAVDNNFVKWYVGCSVYVRQLA